MLLAYLTQANRVWGDSIDESVRYAMHVMNNGWNRRVNEHAWNTSVAANRDIWNDEEYIRQTLPEGYHELRGNLAAGVDWMIKYWSHWYFFEHMNRPWSNGDQS